MSLEDEVRKAKQAARASREEQERQRREYAQREVQFRDEEKQVEQLLQVEDTLTQARGLLNRARLFRKRSLTRIDKVEIIDDHYRQCRGYFLTLSDGGMALFVGWGDSDEPLSIIYMSPITSRTFRGPDHQDEARRASSRHVLGYRESTAYFVPPHYESRMMVEIARRDILQHADQVPQAQAALVREVAGVVARFT